MDMHVEHGSSLPAVQSGRLAAWRRVARELEPLRRRWIRDAPRQVRRVMRKVHLPLLERMAAEAGCYSLEFFLYLYGKGCPLVGDIPHMGASNAQPIPDGGKLATPLETVLRDAIWRNPALLARCRSLLCLGAEPCLAGPIHTERLATSTDKSADPVAIPKDVE